MMGILFPPQASAYLDPGTGSLVVQSLIGGLAIVGYTVRLYWTRIRSVFRADAPVPSKSENRTPESV
jgi:hypothetical protein